MPGETGSRQTAGIHPTDSVDSSERGTMTSAARRISATAEQENAINEASQAGEHLVLVDHNGRTLGVVAPSGFSADIEARLRAVHAKPSDLWTEEDENTIDLAAALEFEAKRAAGELDIVAWDAVKASLGLNTNG